MPIPYQLFLFLNIIRYLLHLLQVVGLTVGRLNTIRAFVRTYFDGKPGVLSREIAVLPRTSKSGAFSARGDSGALVVDAQLAHLIL